MGKRLTISKMLNGFTVALGMLIMILGFVNIALTYVVISSLDRLEDGSVTSATTGTTVDAPPTTYELVDGLAWLVEYDQSDTSVYLIPDSTGVSTDVTDLFKISFNKSCFLGCSDSSLTAVLDDSSSILTSTSYPAHFEMVTHGHVRPWIQIYARQIIDILIGGICIAFFVWKKRRPLPDELESDA